MRKFLLIITLVSASVVTNAQSKLGLKFSPVISGSRVSEVDPVYEVTAGASNAKFSIGLIYDHQLTDTYFFSTGLIYLPKQMQYNIAVQQDTASLPGTVQSTERYNLQYMQLPLTLKMFTNEIIPDGRIFFQVGPALEVMVSNEPTDERFDLVKDFRSVDFSVILGGGFEYRVGINTTLFVEMSYQRGLINQISQLEHKERFQEDVLIRSNILSFDFGIKF